MLGTYPEDTLKTCKVSYFYVKRSKIQNSVYHHMLTIEFIYKTMWQYHNFLNRPSNARNIISMFLLL